MLYKIPTIYKNGLSLNELKQYGEFKDVINEVFTYESYINTKGIHLWVNNVSNLAILTGNVRSNQELGGQPLIGHFDESKIVISSIGSCTFIGTRNSGNFNSNDFMYPVKFLFEKNNNQVLKLVKELVNGSVPGNTYGTANIFAFAFIERINL